MNVNGPVTIGGHSPTGCGMTGSVPWLHGASVLQPAAAGAAPGCRDVVAPPAAGFAMGWDMGTTKALDPAAPLCAIGRAGIPKLGAAAPAAPTAVLPEPSGEPAAPDAALGWRS